MRSGLQGKAAWVGVLVCLSAGQAGVSTSVVSGSIKAESTLHFCIRSEPKTFHPLLVSDDASETIKYLTGGVLIRVNRQTQQLQPGLAAAWTVEEGGKRLDLTLRSNVRFSDGTPFGPEDVVYTIHELMRPELHSPNADGFVSAAGILTAQVTGPHTVRIHLPQAVAGLPALFDEIPMISAKSPLKEKSVLGPFVVTDYKPGLFVMLRRNPNYWERDSAGHPLPYLDAIRIDIQQNREGEALRLRRGEIDFIQNLDPDLFDRLAQTGATNREGALRVLDAGPSLDSELIWFNMKSDSPLPPFKKAWFNDVHFRQGISLAIDRDEICRVIYRRHALPASGPVSPSNQFWFNKALRKPSQDLDQSRKELAAGGFTVSDGQLKDRSGNPVEFSLISNAGNRNHERMLPLIQQNLARVGVRLNVVSLEFPSILERIARTFDYESCLMSLTNVGLDPNDQMNVWMSSGPNHQWNPNQSKPVTAWEQRIDVLMQGQAASLDPRMRKKMFDEVQVIVSEQQPFVYLVHPHVLEAVSKRVKDVSPAVLHPQLYWNAERQSVASK